MKRKLDFTDAIAKKYRQSYDDRVKCEQTIVDALNENQNDMESVSCVDGDNDNNSDACETISYNAADVAGGELSDNANSTTTTTNAIDMNKPVKGIGNKAVGDNMIEKQNKRVKRKRRSLVLPSWLDINRPLEGESLRKSAFVPYKPNVTYEYWDDPNELCERLRVLISSHNAGNTNHAQEIDSIIEELSERGLIS